MKTRPGLKLESFVDLDRFNRYGCNLIKRAFSFSSSAHQHQKRISGDAFIVHPLNVAGMLFEMGFDARVVAAGLLHDTVED
ncbi:MAG: HD domain-containing protein, partial [Spirochaetota bacterium]